MLSAGTLAAGCWKYYDIATNSFSANLATTNLPATFSTDSSFLALDESYVPFDADPGEGFFGISDRDGGRRDQHHGACCGGDSAVLVNEYRNFQIRIVEDTVNPTAVGQRRNITSHTAGASPVYTVPAWTVTPSANAKFVIENNGDRILLLGVREQQHPHLQHHGEHLGHDDVRRALCRARCRVGRLPVVLHPSRRAEALPP